MKKETMEWIGMVVGFLGFAIILVTFLGGGGWAIVDVIRLLGQEASVSRYDLLGPSIKIFVCFLGPVAGFLVVLIGKSMLDE